MIRCARQRDRGVALLMALIMIILIVALVASYLTVSTSNLRLTVSSHDSLQALYVAETGLGEALHELSVYNMAAFKDGKGEPAPSKGPYEGTYVLEGTYSTKNDYDQDIRVGDFTVQLQVLETDPASDETPLLTKLSSQGEYNGIKRVVEASLMHAPNPRIDHAIFAAGDLTIRGNLTVTGDVHANGAITIQGASADILPADPALSDLSSPPCPGAYGGNLTACNGISSDLCNVAGYQDGAAPAAAAGNVSVDVIVAEAKKLDWVIDERRPGAPNYTETWRGTPPDNADLACPAGAPGKLIVVYGDVSLAGRTSGDVVLLATGSITITGNTEWADSPEDGSHLLIVAGEDVTIRGNAEVRGIVFAGGTITGAGNATVNGSLVSSDPAAQGAMNSFAGSLAVNYVRPAEKVEDLLKKWQLISWRQANSD